MFLELLKECSYMASGAYYAESTLGYGLPAELRFRASREPRALCLSGTYYHHAGTPENPFNVRFLFDAENVGRAEFLLDASPLGTIQGSGAFLGGLYSFAGKGESSDSYCGFTIHMLKPEVLELTGVVCTLEKKSFAFALKVLPDDPSIARANVVSIRRS